jgi:hypothetical protein
MAKVHMIRWDETNIVPQLFSSANDTAIIEAIDVSGAAGDISIGGTDATSVSLGSATGEVLLSGSAEAIADFTASAGAEVQGMVNLPSGSNFYLDGTAVDANFTAPNLSTLVNGSNADALHVHTLSISSGSLTSSLLIDPDLVHTYVVGGAIGNAVSGTEVVYLDGTGANKIDLADRDAVGSSRIIGIVSGSTTDTYTSGTNVPVFTFYGDRFDGFTGLTTGAVYYLDSTPGAMTTTPGLPSGGNMAVQVGIAASSTELILQPDIIVRGLT